MEKRLEKLLKLITELHEEACLSELRRLMEAGVDPKTLLSCCMDGMRIIGERFESGTYFIAALIMAGEIMRAATEILSPGLTAPQVGETEGRIMLGTIQGDIHDLGKNLFAMLLKCHNIEVVDLGVDVPGSVFLEKAMSEKPDIIGISCVLTNSVESLKQAVGLLMEKLPEPRIPIVIGGTCLDERMAAYIGANYWANDAASGLKLCREILAGKGSS